MKKTPHPASPSRSRARAVWKGRLSFGLVGIPVELVPAVDSREHIGFHLLHRKDLAPIRYRKFCSREQVEVLDEDVVRGYEVAKGKWAVVEKDELAAADRIGLGRLRLRAREHLAAVITIPHGLAAVLLRPFEEVAAPPAAGSLTAGAGEIRMARLLIDQMTEDTLDPAKYPDRYRSALKKLLAAKRAAAPRPAPATVAPEDEGRVIDLMEALRASVARRGGRVARRKHVA